MKEKQILIPEDIKNEIPRIVLNSLIKMPLEQQEEFFYEFRRKRLSLPLAYLFLLIGFHYIYLGKGIVCLLYWLTGWGMFIWTLIDIIRLPFLIKKMNEDIAIEVMRNIKIMNN